jgi:hypothetical protein
MNRIYKYVILFFIMTNVLSAEDKTGGTTFQTQVSGVGTNAASFLEIGVGARALAMGGAYTAIANDASALYWNPAGIVWLANPQIHVTHNNWFLDSKHDYISAVVPLPSLNSAVGLSFNTLGFDEQPVRTVENPEGTGEFYDARDLALGLSFATALTDRFSFGLTAKYIEERIWHESGGAFAADFGIFYNTQVEGLKLGFSISNFGTTLQLTGRDLDNVVDPDASVQNFDRVPVSYKTQATPLPLLFRVGASYQKSLGSFGSLVAAVDLNHPSNATESINLGLEYGFADMFFFRGGYQNLFEKNSVAGLSLGGGFDWYSQDQSYGVRIDYAWSDWGILSNSQRISVDIIF